MTTLIELYANNAQTTLLNPISSSATSFQVAAGTGALFPSPGAGQFARITFNNASTGTVYEVMYYTSRSGDVFSGVTRGQDGTTAVSWVSGDKVFQPPSSGAMGNLAQQYQVQTNALTYSVDTGSANAYVIAPSPANMSTPVQGSLLYFQAAHVNTGASTITINGSSAYPLLGAGLLPLQGGEVIGLCCIGYNATLSSYVLEWSNGNLQVPNASQSYHAIPYGQAQSTFALIAGSVSQPFSASQLNTTTIYGGATEVTIASNAGARVTNAGQSLLATLQIAPGTVSSTSTQAVTGAQLQSVYKVGEVKMWHGSPSNIASVWGNGWQLADGTNGTADLRSRFIVGAGSTYSVNQTGGAASVTLSVANLPPHTHSVSVSDPGHPHPVNDPSHAHGYNDPGHSHANQKGGYGQAGTDNGGGSFISPSNAYGTWPYSVNSTVLNYTGITIAGAYTGISIGTGYTGISAVANSTGSGSAVGTLPPYYALCFIEYTGLGA